MQRFPIWHIRHRGSYDSLVDVILKNRSLEPSDISNSPDHLQDPFKMQDMDRAVDRILKAIKNQERIVVFGDYDADGVTSTAVLLDFFDHVGADSTYLLPDRFRDGYGMKPKGVVRAVEKGAQLIVTADNGITSFEAIEEANSAGVDVVVIDHHRPQDRLPEAKAMVNPNRVDCEYPFKGLAAVGLAFKVVQALSASLLDGMDRRRYLNSLLDLVALGTVSDMAPMVEENRILTRRGLEVLGKTLRPGIQALKSIAGAKNKPVDTTTIGFFLGPRINSAGRLASAELALNLLRCKDATEAENLAQKLNALNNQRRDLQSQGVREAEKQVEEEGLRDGKILVIQGNDWHLGVVGLIAGNLTDKYWRPSLVCTDYRKNGIYTGSARTIGGYNIVEAIFRVADLLTEYGGHAEAAGFSVPKENYKTFQRRLMEDADQHLTDEALTPQLEVDVALDPSQISMETIHLLSELSPFGSGNELPLFMATGCRVKDFRAVGKGAHLKVTLDTGARECDAMWWREGERAYELSRGDTVDVAFALETNIWRGKTQLQLRVEDMRKAQVSVNE